MFGRKAKSNKINKNPNRPGQASQRPSLSREQSGKEMKQSENNSAYHQHSFANSGVAQQPIYGVASRRETEHRLQKERQRRRQLMKRSRNRALTFFILIALLFVVSFVFIRSIVQKTDEQTKLRFVSNGTLYQSLDTKVLLVRDETVQYTEKAGYLYPLAAEGAHVGYGQKLALLSTENVSELRAQLDSLQKQISLQQLELISQGEGEESESLYELTDASVREAVKVMTEAANAGDLTTVQRENLKVLNAIDQRNIKMAKIEFQDPVLRELQLRKEKLEKELAGVSTEYLNSVAGLVTFSADGLEEALPFSDINSLTAENLAKYFSEPIAFRSTVGDVAEKTAIAKTISSISQYLIFDIPTTNLDYYEDLKSVSCYFPDLAVEIGRADVVHRIYHDKGLYLIAKTEQYVDRFLRNRRMNVQLRSGSESGLIVPLSALKFLDQEQKLADLITVRSGFAHFTRVEVGVRNEDKAVVVPLEEDSGLAAGSLVVQNPGDLKEGDKVEQ